MFASVSGAQLTVGPGDLARQLPSFNHGVSTPVQETACRNSEEYSPAIRARHVSKAADRDLALGGEWFCGYTWTGIRYWVFEQGFPWYLGSLLGVLMRRSARHTVWLTSH